MLNTKTNSDRVYSTRADADLAQAAGRGDKRAFVEIVGRYQAMVCGITLGVLGDFAASEDAAQEAFFAAWRKMHDLREPERLRAWLSQIARNAARCHLRGRRIHEVLDEGLALKDESPGPDDMAAKQEDRALVLSLLATLPELYRIPLVLYYREGQSVHVVAQTLGISDDAVKQRLARGREMLRDRMSGLIETVLTSTGPTAMFTIAVAAAIGALAAPAAAAGSIFSSASAAAENASAASNATAPLVTAMSTSKSFLLATAIATAMCVPVGYYVGSRPFDAPLAGSTSVERGRIPAPTIPGNSFDDSALVAEWRRLHDQYGTTSEAMPLLYKAIGDLKDPFRQRAFQTALIAEWVQLDPAGGLAFITGKGPSGEQRRQFLEEWLARDAAGAVNALLGSGPGWEEMARECLPEIARRVPSRLVEVTSRLPKAKYSRDKGVRDAFAVLAEGDLTSARQAAEAVTGASRQDALGGVAQLWSKRDFDAVLAWAKALPGEVDHDEVIREMLLGKAAVDPIGALERVGLVPAGGSYAHGSSTTASRVLIEAANADFNRTVSWLAANPGRFRREDLAALSEVVTEQLNSRPSDFLTGHAMDGTLVVLLPAIDSAVLNNASGQALATWEWLKTQPDDPTIRQLKEKVLNAAGYQHPDLALRMAADLPATPQGDTVAKHLARSLLNGGHLLHRFNNLVTKAPEMFRQILVRTAFDLLYSDTMKDPQLWINRLSLLSEDARAAGVASIARAWAGQAPEEAITWVGALPTGESRTSALAAVASGWGKQDPYGAADWVATLPAGTARDRSADALASVISERFPEQAWEWALSIQDTAVRDGAVVNAVQAMAARNPAMARQWIREGPFPPETRAELEATLAKPRKPEADN